MSDETNKRIGDYQILNELGSGGMGRVYRVRNSISDRIEAMKILLPDLAGRQELAARFLREIKLMASLNHPNIAALRTAFTAENQLVMIMEYVEGTTLADRLEHGPIPAPEALNYIAQVLSALSYAHGQHVIHRDIKPANIMVTKQGVVKLMDFGIARAGDDRSLTMTGTTLGSLGYMSPEQVKGEGTDARSDLYSLGVSLYEMVTGQRPFRADSDYSLMSAHVREMPKPPLELQPGISPALNEIILMAIAKDPAQRFQSADAFANALKSVGTLPATPQAATSASEAATADYAVPTAPLAAAAATPPSLQLSTPVQSSAPAKVAAPAANLPTAPVPPAAASGHRGLYMTLGALIVLAVLVAGGIYLPRISKTEARQGEARQNPAPVAPPDAASPNPMQPENTPPATVPDAQTPNVPPQLPPGVTPAIETSSSTPGKPTSGQAAPVARSQKSASGASSPVQPPAVPSQGGAAVANPPEAASNPIDRDELEHQIDQLSSRAAAVNSSLDRLQQQQSSAGYGLRGDMVAKQASMKTNLSRAESAEERGDLPQAKKYADMAATDAEALEHFLGH
jgi:eukaryotic-like serine/threonine-protein kinase